MNIKINAALAAVITAGVACIAALIVLGFSSMGLMVALIIAMFSGGEYAAIYFLRRNVIARKQNIFAIVSIALIGVTAIISLIDLRYGSYSLPAWCTVLGLLFLVTGNYILVTALVAAPRHGREEYGEDENPDKSALSVHGPYDVVRHPINLAAILMVFSLPLILSSAFGFIGAVAATAAVIVHAITIENYRFEHYTWYYDYTKKVPYMVFPVIW